MAKSDAYWEAQFAAVAAAAPKETPQAESPIDWEMEFAEASRVPEPEATPLADVGQGLAQGGLEYGQAQATALAGDRSQRPESVSDYISQIPGAAIDLMTGGTGGDFLRRLDLGQYGPGVPPTPEGELGHDLAPAAAMVGSMGGMGAVKGAGAVSRRLRGDPAERELAQRLGTAGREESQYVEDVMGEAYPGGAPATKAQASAVLDEAQLAPGNVAPVMSARPKQLDINQPPPTAGRIPQTAYRDRIKKLLNDATGELIPIKFQKRLMADDGMTVADYYKLKQQIGARSKPPSGKVGLMSETPVAKQRRRAYAEAANALDEMQLPPRNASVEMYGEGRELWRVVSNYERAKSLVAKYVDRAPDGERIWNARAFQKAVDKMDPKQIREIFGDDYMKIVKATKQVVHKGYKAKAKAKKKASLASWKKLRAWGLLGGVTYTGSQVFKDVRTQVTGAPAVRRHSDR